MTRLAQLLLVLTAMAPVAFVHAAVLMQAEGTATAVRWLLVIVVGLGAAAYGLLRAAEHYISAIPKQVENPTSLNSEPLAFLVTYAMPLLASSSGQPWYGIAAFALVVALVIWQQQAFHVNPLLAILGYRFFTAVTDDGSTLIVISRNTSLPAGVLQVYPLSRYVFLQRP